MKKNIYSILLGLIAITFLFSSCKSLTNVSIEKRQHRGGYYVDWGNGKVKTDQVKSQQVSIKQTKISESKISLNDESRKSVLKESDVYVKHNRETDQQQTKNVTIQKSNRHNSFETNQEPLALYSKGNSEKAGSSVKYNFEEGDDSQASSDTPTWVLAILCILLPPLAVFLQFGIGTEFWISLILTLLFWIPGVIYAFVVIF